MNKVIRNLVLILIAIFAGAFLLYKTVFTPAEVAALTPAAKTSMVSMVGNYAATHSFSSGPIAAKVTVVEFFDPECESCARVAPLIKKEMQHYEGKVRWVFRYMPYHFNSKTAIKVLEAARKQDLFLETLEVLFKTQSVWGEQRVSTEKQILEVIASVPKIDLKLLKKDMSDPSTNEIIDRDESEGKQAGVQGTPTFFVNGVILENLDLDRLIAKINEQLGE